LAGKGGFRRGFLAADVGAGAVVNVDIEIPARPARVLADQAGGVGLLDRLLEHLALADVFAAYIDVAGLRPHREGRDQAPLDQQVRIVPHDIPVLAGAGLGLIRVDDQIVRPLADLLGHEGPFEAGRESRPAPTTQARRLDLVADPLRAELHKLLRGIPRAALLRRFQPEVMAAVQVGEDAISIEKHGRAPGNT
jgi:hypothetical protein